MKIIFLTFYYPPDLCAGSFRAVALVEALSKKMSSEDEIHVITTHPNRYLSHETSAENLQIEGNVTIRRIQIPNHQIGMISQVSKFTVYAWHALRHCFKLQPDFIIGTTSRLMTGVLTWLTSFILRNGYFVDIRDIFSETISDLFLLKNTFAGRCMKSFFLLIERKLLKNATGVNVVSEGFHDYFQESGIDTSKWTFFPNGVDREFTNSKFNSARKCSSLKTVFYAGNIGSGQGMELIVPEVAKQLGSNFKFQIVGDGSTFKLLEERIKALDVGNVDLLPPVERKQLIKHYCTADILFLHLNNVSAFKRVLPSKLFEYIAVGKPIVAGLNGYSARFIKKNIGHACLFRPGDVDECILCIQKAIKVVVNHNDVDQFIKKYSRVNIMEKMANHIVSIASNNV